MHSQLSSGVTISLYGPLSISMLCVYEQQGLERLHIYAGMPESLLLVYTLSTIISQVGLFMVL